jgi:hypothetical protein
MFSTTQSPDPANKFTILPPSSFLIILLYNRAIKSLLITNLPQKVVSLLCLISGRSVTILLTATEFNVNSIILIGDGRVSDADPHCFCKLDLDQN